nr:A/G-specific adenine glycosylase [Sphingomicrobium nitratireducens]
MLEFYRENARALPWRARPGSNVPADPYRVWLSEVMLQQTTVATVTPRFSRFLEKWPQIEDLAAAPLEDLLAEWAGLGYYARARNLHACARAVVANGGFPQDEAGLRALPGIGAYTAAAIAAIAFERDSVPIDTNVERVVARLEGIEGPLAETRPKVHAAARALWPAGRAGDYAQAMMDLGATICRPKNPRCDVCPICEDCAAFASGDPEAIPARKAKKVRPERRGTAWWIEKDGAVWLVRRPGKGMLGGMAALPGTSWEDGAPNDIDAPHVRHVFTHFALTLAVERRASPPGGEGWWQPLSSLGDAGLPTLYAKAAALMTGQPVRA